MAVKQPQPRRLRGRLASIRRTRQLVSDQIDVIDRAAPDPQARPTETVAALTSLVRLLESLQRLERCHRNECAQRAMERRERLDDQRLRDELARRIDAHCTTRDADVRPRDAEPERAQAESR
jgi:hypothetical protein